MIKSIYIIKNKINDKVYVGQAINPHRRFIQHLCNGKQLLDSYPIHLAINKYGKGNFYFEILEENVENYNERERYWIKFYNCISPNGYNLSEGGENNPILKGENNPRNTLTDETAINIIEQLLYSNKSQREIAKENNCSERIVNSINAGETRRQESLTYPLRSKCCHYSKRTLEEIKWLLKNSKASLDSIAIYYDLTKGAIAQINKGKSHADDNENYPLRTGTGIPLTKYQITALLMMRE